MADSAIEKNNCGGGGEAKPQEVAVKTEAVAPSNANSDNTAGSTVKEECPPSVKTEPASSSPTKTAEKEVVNPQPQKAASETRPQAASPAGSRTVTPTNLSRSPSPHIRGRGSMTESRFLPDHMEGVAQFIIKLYDLVCDTATSKLITWSEEHNKEAFVVYDPSEFASTILPNYFKHANFCSFVRQLNIYGFRKIESKEGYVFQQENFRYGAPELLKNIQRRKQAHKRPAPPPPYAPPQRIPGVMNTLYTDVNGAPLAANQGCDLSSLASVCAAVSNDSEHLQQKLTTPILSIPDVIASMRADIIDLQTSVRQMKDLLFQSIKRQEEMETRLQKIEAITTPHFFPTATLGIPAGAAAFPTLTAVKIEMPQVPQNHPAAAATRP